MKKFSVPPGDGPLGTPPPPDAPRPSARWLEPWRIETDGYPRWGTMLKPDPQYLLTHRQKLAGCVGVLYADTYEQLLALTAHHDVLAHLAEHGEIPAQWAERVSGPPARTRQEGAQDVS